MYPHKRECVRRLNTPIDDRMYHLNDGLYIFFCLQCGLCRKNNNIDHICKRIYE